MTSGEREYSACFFSAADSLKAGQLSTSSDDPRANQAMLIERKLLLHYFLVNPTFFFITGKNGSSNAYATREVIGSNPDGTVAFGVSLMKSEVAESGGPNMAISIPAIMAHEFAHLLQYKNGNAASGVSAELQADYLAGWYLGKRNGTVQLSERGLASALRSFYQKGDYDFNSSLHHGTPQQRANAVQAGYKNSSLNLRDAYNASLIFAGLSPQSRPLSSVLSFSIPDFEQVLDQLMNQRDDGFAHLRGALELDTKATWIATLKLPGADECTVSWRNQYQGSYECTMIWSLDELLIRNHWDKILEVLRYNYADGWEIKLDDHPEGKIRIKEVYFTSSEANKEFSMSLAKLTTRRGYRLAITIPFDNY
jgi:hypothetical protein